MWALAGALDDDPGIGGSARLTKFGFTWTLPLALFSASCLTNLGFRWICEPFSALKLGFTWIPLEFLDISKIRNYSFSCYEKSLLWFWKTNFKFSSKRRDTCTVYPQKVANNAKYYINIVVRLRSYLVTLLSSNGYALMHRSLLQECIIDIYEMRTFSLGSKQNWKWHLQKNCKDWRRT